MKLLLDTHVFLWYIAADPRLKWAYRDAIQDPTNDVYLSAVSIWESVIKFQLGKLPMPANPAVYLPEKRRMHGIDELHIDEGAMVHLASLPPLHGDPFDRLMIAQAIQHSLTFVTVDANLVLYPVQVL